jgi:hypothetical protein
MHTLHKSKSRKKCDDGNMHCPPSCRLPEARREVQGGGQNLPCTLFHSCHAGLCFTWQNAAAKHTERSAAEGLGAGSAASTRVACGGGCRGVDRRDE